MSLLAQAEAGEAVVYFADAAHPTYNTRATYVWTQRAQERPLATVSGRERVNLNAALNAVVPTQLHLDETAHVNDQCAQRLDEKLLVAHSEGPIYVVCDNARYYQNKELSGRPKVSQHFYQQTICALDSKISLGLASAKPCVPWEPFYRLLVNMQLISKGRRICG